MKKHDTRKTNPDTTTVPDELLRGSGMDIVGTMLRQINQDIDRRFEDAARRMERGHPCPHSVPSARPRADTRG